MNLAQHRAKAHAKNRAAKVAPTRVSTLDGLRADGAEDRQYGEYHGHHYKGEELEAYRAGWAGDDVMEWAA